MTQETSRHRMEQILKRELTPEELDHLFPGQFTLVRRVLENANRIQRTGDVGARSLGRLDQATADFLWHNLRRLGDLLGINEVRPLPNLDDPTERARSDALSLLRELQEWIFYASPDGLMSNAAELLFAKDLPPHLAARFPIQRARPRKGVASWPHDAACAFVLHLMSLLRWPPTEARRKAACAFVEDAAGELGVDLGPTASWSQRTKQSELGRRFQANADRILLQCIGTPAPGLEAPPVTSGHRK